jgi:small-conductance mechanosensitive channel
MFPLAPKAVKRHISGSCKQLFLFACAVLVLMGGLFGQWFAFSQQLPNGLDAEARGRDVVAHLNAVIQFYRATAQPIQKAGEPNDVVYRDQAVALSAQIADFAFQSAKAEGALMARYQTGKAAASDSAGSSEQEKLQTVEGNVEKRIGDLQARRSALEDQLARAKPREVAALQAEKKQIQGSLNLENAMKEALEKIVGLADSAGATGLEADIDRLKNTVPELQSKNKTASPQLTTIDSARSAGVTSQGMVLIDLLETRHALDSLMTSNGDLHTQAMQLRKPLSNILHNLVQQGQQLSQQAEVSPAAAAAANPAPSAITPSAPVPLNIEAITAQFKALSAATVPLSQEVIVLEQSRANLVAWQASVEREYASILHALLLRMLVIAIALGLILGGGEVWKHATNKYIRDIRRRRQFLIVRRTVVGFLSAIVVLFGFVTEFNSLATFAGFITAGIAVGLQTILLSVAAYFFIIGRYGVKVGDRITIASVTGDVIDVGLVRFYVMEMAGSGTELNPTGRVAVFSNAVLFQAGTPLYKQIPGTEYAWHELIVKLADAANYQLVCEAVLKEVNTVYAEYRAKIEQQHQSVEIQMQTTIVRPAIESRLQFNAGAFQLWTRFPVQIKRASETDDKLIQALVHLIGTNPEIKSAVASTPVIQASVRG